MAEFHFHCVRCQELVLAIDGEPSIEEIRSAEQRHQAECVGPIPITTHLKDH